MVLSKEIINYLQNTGLPSSINQNFLLTDFNKIIYAATFNDNAYYLNNTLSNDLIELINNWLNNSSEDSYIIKSKNTLSIVQNDLKRYSAQLFLPIFEQKNLIGIAIFFRNYGDYIESSLKTPKTIKNFIQLHLNNKTVI